jgi:hypothetical protein
MFDEGVRMKPSMRPNVFDFSLGNLIGLAKVSCGTDQVAVRPPACMAIWPTAATRQWAMVVGEVSRQQGVTLGQEVIMTCGAAGALNV